MSEDVTKLIDFDSRTIGLLVEKDVYWIALVGEGSQAEQIVDAQGQGIRYAGYDEAYSALVARDNFLASRACHKIVFKLSDITQWAHRSFRTWFELHHFIVERKDVFSRAAASLSVLREGAKYNGVNRAIDLFSHKDSISFHHLAAKVRHLKLPLSRATNQPPEAFAELATELESRVDEIRRTDSFKDVKRCRDKVTAHTDAEGLGVEKGLGFRTLDIRYLIEQSQELDCVARKALKLGIDEDRPEPYGSADTSVLFRLLETGHRTEPYSPEPLGWRYGQMGWRAPFDDRNPEIKNPFQGP